MPAENGPQSWMMFCGVGLLIWLFIRGKLMRKRQQKHLAPIVHQFKHNGNTRLEPIVFEGTQSMGAPREVLQWQVELHDLARQLKGELDSRLIAVRSISHSFDQAVQKINALVEASQSPTQALDTPAAQMIRLSRAGFTDQQIASQFGVDEHFIQVLVSSSTTNNG